MEKIYYLLLDSSKIYVSSWCFRPFFFQLINELRLRLPLSERDEITSEAKKAAGLTEENYETKRALKVAQATVSSLQVCLLPTYDTESLENSALGSAWRGRALGMAPCCRQAIPTAMR